uniref:Threonine synthase N-terminal domain-containing protein n=1 Tax=Rhizochromulina marina TaxID=1034831 RepID=A0A7S2SVW5_9STRA
MATNGVTYRSTRGGASGMRFESVVLAGLAPDRGLYVPESMPSFSPAEIEAMRTYSFEDQAFAIMSKFISRSEIPEADLRSLVNKSYKSFRDPLVTPVVKTGNVHTLELFHGPTFAFKDVALQFLGNLFEYFIGKKQGSERRLTIMGATSGDTGSAAIYGLRGKANVNCFILYPKGRVSAIQERQMATVPDSNIHCLCVEGNFDDCQDIVKGAFMDKSFRDEVKLGAVNSINWARVLAQITYYFHAYYQVTATGKDPNRKINFSVPTGNFGDILAGYYAKRMGLPVRFA